MGEAAGPASIASLGLGAISDVYSGMGEQATQDFLAARDKRAAAYGRVKAEQTDVQLREQTQTTLGRIETMRAAAGADLSSPTTDAILTEETRVADRDRNIRVSNILAQAREDEMSATYRQEVGKRALISGFLKGGTRILAGIGGMGGGGAGPATNYGVSYGYPIQAPGL